MKQLLIRISQVIFQVATISLFALKNFLVEPKSDSTISSFELMFNFKVNIGISITLWIFAITIILLFVFYLLYFIRRKWYDKLKIVINATIFIGLLSVVLIATLWGTYLRTLGIISLGIATLSAFLQYIDSIPKNNNSKNERLNEEIKAK